MDRIDQSEESDLVAALSFLALGNAARLQVLRRVLAEGSFSNVSSILNGRQRDVGKCTHDRCEQLGIDVVTVTDPRYPRALRYTDGAPLVLFLRGNNRGRAVPETSIGVVGTRAASVQVCQRASMIASDLVSAGFVVVSGLALGIDGAAHRGALEHECECPTVAVLAHGLDKMYPASHQGLASQIIASGGLLVSEYPPGTEPLKHHFLARNRIIAGLSRGVVIVQAGARSGSLVTAQFAVDFGRDVFIVSSESDDDRYCGGRLMVEQGAIEVSSAFEILREYGIARPASEGLTITREVSVVEAMRLLEASQVELLAMELRGEITRLPGNRVLLRAKSV